MRYTRRDDELIAKLPAGARDEALRLSGPYGNAIPGVRYLFETMRGQGWSLGDAASALERIQRLAGPFCSGIVSNCANLPTGDHKCPVDEELGRGSVVTCNCCDRCAGICAEDI